MNKKDNFTAMQKGSWAQLRPKNKKNFYRKVQFPQKALHIVSYFSVTNAMLLSLKHETWSSIAVFTLGLKDSCAVNATITSGLRKV